MQFAANNGFGMIELLKNEFLNRAIQAILLSGNNNFSTTLIYKFDLKSIDCQFSRRKRFLKKEDFEDTFYVKNFMNSECDSLFFLFYENIE
ncbi:hypothetical protein LEP1GSC071_0474 [Leptospira santarosai str. JET]|nr:hypothetical protein LEP1GSC071_0474 [Leptospira santarosai str. JET]